MNSSDKSNPNSNPNSTSNCFKNPTAVQQANGDKEDNGTSPRYIGCFHKSLPHNDYGEVDENEFRKLRDAGINRAKASAKYDEVEGASTDSDRFVNPVAGLGLDRLAPLFIRWR